MLNTPNMPNVLNMPNMPNMPNMLNRCAQLAAVFGVAAIGLVSGCDPHAALCAKKQECNDRLEDDTYNVCVANLTRDERMLRANDEEVCHRVADATRAFHACLASLECRDFEDQDYDACETEQDALADAVEDSDGECLSTN